MIFFYIFVKNSVGRVGALPTGTFLMKNETFPKSEVIIFMAVIIADLCSDCNIRIGLKNYPKFQPTNLHTKIANKHYI